MEISYSPEDTNKNTKIESIISEACSSLENEYIISGEEEYYKLLEEKLSRTFEIMSGTKINTDFIIHNLPRDLEHIYYLNNTAFPIGLIKKNTLEKEKENKLILEIYFRKLLLLIEKIPELTKSSMVVEFSYLNDGSSFEDIHVFTPLINCQSYRCDAYSEENEIFERWTSFERQKFLHFTRVETKGKIGERVTAYNTIKYFLNCIVRSQRIGKKIDKYNNNSNGIGMYLINFNYLKISLFINLLDNSTKTVIDYHRNKLVPVIESLISADDKNRRVETLCMPHVMSSTDEPLTTTLIINIVYKNVGL
jgi:hypothetical protein